MKSTKTLKGIDTMIMHPCFNEKVKGTCGRVHLPVAPKCNIRCNYCDRKYDCVNESRPGVTSQVLSPHQALSYMKKVLEREPRITVAGIAGPGDPFANPVETLETLRLIKKEFPEILLCLATNGLNIGPYVDELKRIGVTHVTVTINATSPKIGAKIYGWVRDGKVVYRGEKGAKLLLKRQREALVRLKACGMTVKVNSILIPGINDDHILDVAKEIKEYGVDLFNAMAIFPNPGTPFGDIAQPSKEAMEEIRRQAAIYLPQMRHCTRCRADAVGLLGEDRSSEFRGCLSACSKAPRDGSRDRIYIAVATREGILVNQHLGEAETLEIWSMGDGGSPDGIKLIERRPTPRPGTGLRRWVELSRILKDCKFLLVSGIGERPKEVLIKSGITPLVVSGFIEECLLALRPGGNINAYKKSKNTFCKGGAGRDCVFTGSH